MLRQPLRHAAACLFATLMPVCLNAQPLRVHVAIHNDAQLPRTLLFPAATLVEAIYADAGVGLEWIHMTPEVNTAMLTQPKVRIRIVGRAVEQKLRQPPGVIGFTPSIRGAQLAFAYVLEERVRAVARGYGVPASVVLAAALPTSSATCYSRMRAIRRAV